MSVVGWSTHGGRGSRTYIAVKSGAKEEMQPLLELPPKAQKQEAKYPTPPFLPLA